MKTTIRAIPIFLVLIWPLFAVPFAELAQSPSPYTIVGDLRGDAGKSISDFTVCAIPLDDGVARVRDKICAQTDDQGRFTINLTQVGKYQVVREKISEGYMASYDPFYRDPRVSIPEITISDNNRNASVSIVLGAKSGVITGKVIDEAADIPVQNFVVWVWQHQNPTARYHQVNKGTDSAGRFRLFAPPMAFQMRVSAEGYEDWVMGGGELISSRGAKAAPGALIVPSETTADFAVYMKRKNQAPADGGDPQRLAAPTLLSPGDNVVLAAFPRMMKLEWESVAGATSYAVEVEACWKPRPGSRLPDDGECINPSPHFERAGLANTTVEFMFRGAQPGRWRVWAIDQNNRPGLKSHWRRFVHQR